MSAAPPLIRAHRLEVLDSLRGLTALWVVLFHFTQNGATHHGYPADSWLKSLGTYGYLGVYTFFTISGFIIPWSLDRGGYHVKDYFRFMLKRLLRLHPLYLLSVLIMAVPYFMWHANILTAEGWKNIWPQLFFLNAIMGRPWLMELYWTLALDFQYCLLVGLIFPFLASSRAWVRFTALGLFLATACWTEPVFSFKPNAWVTHYAAYFAMGTATFWWLRRMVNLPVYLGVLALCFLMAMHTNKAPHAFVGLVTALSISFVPLRHPILSWLGLMSYPVYLFHLIIGDVLNIQLSKLARDPWRDGAGVLAAIILSLAGSWLLHKWIETPSQRWSSAVKFRHRRPAK